MTYLLRCSPWWRSNDDLIQYDTFLKETLKDICNCSFNENSWSQSTLPVSLGDLGFRNLTSLCYSSFLDSIHGVAQLLLTILHAYISQSSDIVLVEVLCHWLK
jgi:hypothetical protein